jgi:hypothetical protein
MAKGFIPSCLHNLFGPRSFPALQVWASGKALLCSSAFDVFHGRAADVSTAPTAHRLRAETATHSLDLKTVRVELADGFELLVTQSLSEPGLSTVRCRY